MKPIFDPFDFSRFRPFVCFDVESDGRTPGLFSMTALAAVIVEPGLKRRFVRYIRPLPGASWEDEALAVSGMTHEMTISDQKFEDPEKVMKEFVSWIRENCEKPLGLTDNPGFDWMFLEWYMVKFMGRKEAPLGHTCRDLNGLYYGLKGDMNHGYGHLSITKNTHDPLDDALCKAEVALMILSKGDLVPKVK